MDIKNELGLHLSHKDIFDKEFTKRFRGYNPLEVDQLLDYVINDYKIMMKEIISLRKQLGQEIKNDFNL